MRIDKVMRDRADLMPVEPLAGPALDRIEEEQRPFLLMASRSTDCMRARPMPCRWKSR